MNNTPLHNSLRAACVALRKADKRDGTTARGFDCIYSALPFARMADLPRGTNAIYVVKQALREVLAERAFAGYVLA